MTFQSNIPLSTDLLSVSQGDILGNFQALGSAWPVNHVDFNASGAGKHKYVEFPDQGSDPAGAASELTLFAKLDAGSTTQLYYKRNAEGTSYQLTAQNPTIASSGSTFLPGGIILKWGSASVTNSQAVSFASAFPTACWQVICQPINNGAVTVANDYVYVQSSPTTTQFTATAVKRTSLSGNTVTFSYIAIGN